MRSRVSKNARQTRISGDTTSVASPLCVLVGARYSSRWTHSSSSCLNRPFLRSNHHNNYLSSSIQNGISHYSPMIPNVMLCHRRWMSDKTSNKSSNNNNNKESSHPQFEFSPSDFGVKQQQQSEQEQTPIPAMKRRKQKKQMDPIHGYWNHFTKWSVPPPGAEMEPSTSQRGESLSDDENENENEMNNDINDNNNSNNNKPKLRKLAKTSSKQKTKTYAEKKEELEKKYIRREYRWYGLAIACGFAFVIYKGAALYYTDIGRADGFWKAGIHYETIVLDLAKAKEAYMKALDHSDYAYPKYLHEYARFLVPPADFVPPKARASYLDESGEPSDEWDGMTEKERLFARRMKENMQVWDIDEAEAWCRRAIQLHPTNPIYHRTLMEILERVVEDGDDFRETEAIQQRERTVMAHIAEANFFLTGQREDIEKRRKDRTRQGVIPREKSMLGYMDKTYRKIVGKNVPRNRSDFQENLIMEAQDRGDYSVARMHMNYAISMADKDPELRAKVFEVAARTFDEQKLPHESSEFWKKGMGTWKRGDPSQILDSVEAKKDWNRRHKWTSYCDKAGILSVTEDMKKQEEADGLYQELQELGIEVNNNNNRNDNNDIDPASTIGGKKDESDRDLLFDEEGYVSQYQNRHSSLLYNHFKGDPNTVQNGRTGMEKRIVRNRSRQFDSEGRRILTSQDAAFNERVHQLVKEKFAIFLFEKQEYTWALQIIDEILDETEIDHNNNSNNDENKDSNKNNNDSDKKEKSSKTYTIGALERTQNSKNRRIVALTFKGKILADLEQYEEALEIFTKALILTPLSEVIPVEMAMILCEMGRLDDAMVLLDNCGDLMRGRNISQQDCTARALYFLSLMRAYVRMLQITQEKHESDRSAEEKHELAELNAEVYGIVNENLEDFWCNYLAARYFDDINDTTLIDKADRYYRTALQIEPTWAFAIYQYARFLIEKADDEVQGKRHLNSAHMRNPLLPRLQKYYDQVFFS